MKAFMSEILKFPDRVSRRSSDGTPEKTAAGVKDRTVTKMPVGTFL
jgi:hypothetical protein